MSTEIWGHIYVCTFLVCKVLCILIYPLCIPICFYAYVFRNVWYGDIELMLEIDVRKINARVYRLFALNILPPMFVQPICADWLSCIYIQKYVETFIYADVYTCI